MLTQVLQSVLGISQQGAHCLRPPVEVAGDRGQVVAGQTRPHHGAFTRAQLGALEHKFNAIAQAVLVRGEVAQDLRPRRQLRRVHLAPVMVWRRRRIEQRRIDLAGDLEQLAADQGPASEQRFARFKMCGGADNLPVGNDEQEGDFGDARPGTKDFPIGPGLLQAFT